MSNGRSLSLEDAGEIGLRRVADFKSPNRIQTSILAARERGLLDTLCRRMPAWVTPDLLTAIGAFGAAIAALGYFASGWRPEFLFLASLGVVVNWFGDSLDGSLARHRRIERPRYGFFLDHSVDAINNLILAVGLGLSPYVSMDAALFLGCSYYLLSINVFLTVQTERELQLSYAYFGPTELRLLAIVFNSFIFVVGPWETDVTGSKTSVYTLLVVLEATIFIVVFISDVFVKARNLKSLDQNALQDITPVSSDQK